MQQSPLGDSDGRNGSGCAYMTTVMLPAQAPRTTLLLVFMNSFKIGVIAALIADALKLQG